MNIKNYTSSVPVEVSMGKIEKTLVSVGARQIMKSYEDSGNCDVLSFQIAVNNIPISFRLTSRVDSIYKKLFDQYTRPTDKSREICEAQAARTAWKIISDWVDIQVTMIILDQAEIMQVFLPYIHDGKSSLYEKLSETGFKLLK